MKITLITLLLLIHTKNLFCFAGEFNNEVIRLVGDPNQSDEVATKTLGGRKVLVYLPANQVITSYAMLEQILTILGWERFFADPNLIQYHKRSSIDIISLPRDFSKFNYANMYDVMVKNPDSFEIRDA